MRPGLPRPGLRIGVSVRPPLPMRAPPKLPPMWPPPKPPLATRPPPKPPPNPLASAVVEARLAAAIVAAVARAKVRVSLRDMVVLRGLGLSRIPFQYPLVGAAGKRFKLGAKNLRGAWRHLSGYHCTKRTGGQFSSPHQRLTDATLARKWPCPFRLAGRGPNGETGRLAPKRPRKFFSIAIEPARPRPRPKVKSRRPPMQTTSDENLIGRIGGGDRLAMQVLYARHHVRVYR